MIQFGSRLKLGHHVIRLELSQRTPLLSFVDWKISIRQVLCKTTLYFDGRHFLSGNFIPRLIALFLYSLPAFQEKDGQYSVSAVGEHVVIAKESTQLCGFRIFKAILFVDAIVKETTAFLVSVITALLRWCPITGLQLQLFVIGYL